MGCGGSKTDSTSDVGTWSTFDANAKPQKSALKKPEATDSNSNSGRPQDTSSEDFSGVGAPSGGGGQPAAQPPAARVIKRVAFLDENSNRPVGPQDEPGSHNSRRNGATAKDDELSRVDNNVPAFVSLGVVEGDDDDAANANGQKADDATEPATKDNIRKKSDADEEEGGDAGTNNKGEGGGGKNPLAGNSGAHHHQEVDTMHEQGRTSSPISPTEGSGRNSPSPQTPSADDLKFREEHAATTAGENEGDSADNARGEEDGESPSNTSTSEKTKDSTLNSNENGDITPKSALHHEGDSDEEGGEKQRRRVSFTNRAAAE